MSLSSRLISLSLFYPFSRVHFCHLVNVSFLNAVSSYLPSSIFHTLVYSSFELVLLLRLLLVLVLHPSKPTVAFQLWQFRKSTIIATVSVPSHPKTPFYQTPSPFANSSDHFFFLSFTVLFFFSNVSFYLLPTFFDLILGFFHTYQRSITLKRHSSPVNPFFSTWPSFPFTLPTFQHLFQPHNRLFFAPSQSVPTLASL